MGDILLIPLQPTRGSATGRCPPTQLAEKHFTVLLIILRAVTVLDFSLPRWCSNKYRGLAVNRTTPPSKKNWRGHTCASAWSAAPKRLRAAEPQHIVARVRFHWSHEEMYFQSERFVGRAYTHCISTSTKVHAADWATEDLVFKLNVKDCFLNQRRWHK